MNKLYIFGVLFISGCTALTTEQVQERCAEAEALIKDSMLAPSEVRVAVTLGSRLCQDPRYAALRERVILWLRDRK